MKRRNFLKALGAIVAAGFIPTQPKVELLPFVTGSAALMDAAPRLNGFAYHVSNSSGSWQGINTRAYPTLTAKVAAQAAEGAAR